MNIKYAKETVVSYGKEPSFIFFIIFILSLGLVLYKAVQMENVSDNYEKYDKIINKLGILNSNYDTFLTQKLTFISYDDIAKDVKQFRVNISLLNNAKFLNNYGKDMSEDLVDLETEFDNKIDLLERYKSYSATTISSLSYILNFNTTVRYSGDMNEKINHAVLDIAKLFAGVKLSDKDIQESIKIIGDIYKKEEKNDLKYLWLNMKQIEKSIIVLNKLGKEIKDIPLSTTIEKIGHKIEQNYQNKINSLKNLAIVMLIMSIILLIVFVYRYIIFMRNAEDLVSFRYAVENSDNTVMITDADRNITYVNEAFNKNTGYTKEEAIGKNPKMLRSGLLPQEFYDKMNRALADGEKWSGDFVNRDKYGKIYYEKTSITPVYKYNMLIGYMAIKLNVTDYIEQEKKVVHLAEHDQLTGLKNRRAMEIDIKRNIKDARYSDTKLAILFLDLDNFKTINDSLGHNIGDLLLKFIAKRLKNNLGKSDGIYRFGGDEFVIVVTKNVTEKNALMIAKRVINLVNKPLILENNNITSSASIGISMYPEDGEDMHTLLKNADIAMYSSKMSGKNRYKFYYENFSQELKRSIDIEHELANALKNSEFSVVYQPKYSLKTKEVVSLELLIRWKNKKIGIVPPDIFIPIAENLGFINDIGRYVFREACRDFQCLKQHFSSLKNISVNVSAVQLSDKSLKKDFEKIIKEEGVAPEDLALEITETSLMRNIKENVKILDKFSSLGFKICMDDFGTGYSSLNYLVQLPINNIKIDKTFIDVIFSGKKELEMIKSILSISQNLDFRTIAEGIETQEQEDLLRDIGVDFGQGFYFSKPLSKEELVKFKS